ncbi:DUF6461 domain-containing protein [Actinoplanes siamensis]|uniref:Uncharacterized protein n=1 Tax=Actinoplanes siamensis TaxID=1223317 RepID=A0A919N641_9ACTN|nr:DUF6461 domain-containing protein [Actinoplanes siamensis]GIF05070.1 hypothetical protein Asi03nite_26080 [Actinoplanes siamensis]
MNDELAAFTATAMPALIERIPAAPARLLGRLRVPEERETRESRRSVAVSVRPSPARHPGGAGEEAAAVVALRAVGAPTAERLLGALELFLAGQQWSAAPGLTDGVPGRPPEARYMMVSCNPGGQSDAVEAVALLERLHPGVAGRTVILARAVTTEPAVAALLTTTPDGADEPALAARHGAAHLALAVAVAGSVIHQINPAPLVDRVPATVGLATGVAALLLRELPMPQAYPQALLAKIRAEYVLPRHTHSRAVVAGHRFGLSERGTCPDADFSDNGLVTVVDGGIVIRTGISEGAVSVDVAVLADAPAEVDPHWPDVVEVSWHATEGRASMVAPGDAGSPALAHLTPPWPGDYRVRVHARGRDDRDAAYESYRLTVWSAPAGPETVHRRFDLLGHRLRGEREPVRPVPPEHAYRWVGRTHLAVAATITVVTGLPLAGVLRAFGADPDRPEPFDPIQQILTARPGGPAPQWITALDAGDAVVVVEDNGYRGSNASVLRAASAHGRAASMFWNVNAATRLSFAERGALLASFEPWGNDQAPPEVIEVLTDLDFAGPGSRAHKGLVAVERFTGQAFTATDLAAIEATGIGYRIDP